MCGILFVFDPTRPAAELQAAASRALACMAHRGPDAGGLAEGPGWVIGHRRLSIIDLGASAQPMPVPEGNAFLTFNGEVYNYRELRPALAPRWPFRTSGDTEVLLAGLRLHGPDFLNRAEGMWALALWDAGQHSLLLARDRMGKKPLYLLETSRSCYLASELPALLALLPYTPAQDLDSTADYLRYGYPLPGHTFYQGVRELLPGHWLRWRPATPAETGRYWQLPAQPAPAPRRAAAGEQLREALGAAVARRLVADVEVGAFLSGGIDSAIIVALAAGLAPTPPRTFTVGFSDAAFDERAPARAMAAALGTRHAETLCPDLTPETLLELIAGQVGQPFADTSLLPTALVSRFAAGQVKVALSGDGGDELFAGYQRYLGRSLLRWYSRLPPAMRRGAERALRWLPEPMAHHSRSLLKKAHLFVDLVERTRSAGPYVAPTLLTPAELARLAPDLAGRGHPPPALPPECEPDDIRAMMLADALVYLPQDILVKVDRASMAASLEARAPFLDRAVVELAFSLPRTCHLRGLTGKRLLRDAFRPLLPAAVWQRRKRGFAVPVYRWYCGPWGDKLTEQLAAAPGGLNPAEVAGMLARHRAGTRDHGHLLWVIDCYLRWLHP